MLNLAIVSWTIAAAVQPADLATLPPDMQFFVAQRVNGSTCPNPRGRESAPDGELDG